MYFMPAVLMQKMRYADCKINFKAIIVFFIEKFYLFAKNLANKKLSNFLQI